MNKLLNFRSIKAKMVFGFSIVIFLVLALGGFSFYVMNNVNKTTEQVLNDELPLLIADEQLSAIMYSQVGAVRGYVLTGDSSYKDIFHGGTESVEENIEIVNKIGASEEFNELMGHTEEWRDYIVLDVLNEYDKGNTDEATKNLLNAETYVGDLISRFNDMATSRENYIIDLEEGILASGKSTLNFIIGVGIFSVIVGIVVALITANTISRPLRVVMDRMRLITSGDLSAEPLETNARDEIGLLVESTNEMNETTRELLNQISEVAETVSSGSEELTQSASEVKAGTEQIAITMEELATGSESQANNAADLSSGMSVFTNQVTEANENGEYIRVSTNEVLEMTNEGSELMQASTEQMSSIDRIVHDAVLKVEGLDRHAQQISELVAVIQDIANQTNLLALNAAIEAARAGEHGQGFAVVANEVRVLAEQSSESVTNITDIVNNIQEESSLVASSLQESYDEVEQGTNQIVTTSKTFNQISTAVTEVVDRINVVSQNLSDIESSSQRMNSAIQEIAAISEESAAGVEETSASAQQASGAMEEVTGSSTSLAKLAEELNGLLRRFKL